jgi:hypothetical protein
MNNTPALSTLVWEGDRAPFAKAFVAAQKATEAVKKANSNPAFKSKYADLAAVVEAVVPALNNAGIGVLQFPAYDGDFVSITTTLIHESGSSVTATLALRPSKSDPQGVGSATTYARRYSLLAMTGAAPEDDDGNAASGPQEPRRTAQEPQRQEPKPPTLAERADRLEATLRAASTPADLTKAWNLSDKLRKELDERDPERLVAVEQLHKSRADALAPKHLEAAE